MINKLNSLPISFIEEAISYNPETGEFIWKVRPAHHFDAGPQRSSAQIAKVVNGARAGHFAGSVTIENYRVITISGVALLAHRIAFALMTGEWPSHEVDHKNGLKSDNRWVNIRSATRAENAMNLALRRDNLSGVVGVGWHRPSKKWRARITAAKVTRCLGSFETFEDACAVRQCAERELGFHANHGRPAA